MEGRLNLKDVFHYVTYTHTRDEGADSAVEDLRFGEMLDIDDEDVPL